MSQAGPYLFWAGICLIAGATLYSEMLDRSATDDPFGDGAEGDWAALPEDFKTLFHATENTRGGQ